MSFRKNRLLAAIERAIADLRGAVDAIVNDDYDEAGLKFERARDTLNAQAAELQPGNDNEGV